MGEPILEPQVSTNQADPWYHAGSIPARMQPAPADTAIRPIPGSASLKLRLLILLGITAAEGLRSFVNVGRHRAPLANWLVGFCMMLAALTFRPVIANLRRVKSEWALLPVSWSFGALHLAALLTLSLISKQMATTHSGAILGVFAGVWFAVVIAALIFAGLTVLPYPIWREIGKGTGRFWVPAAAGAALIGFLNPLIWRQWQTSQWEFAINVTFRIVSWLLRGVLPSVVADPAAHLIGSERFSVTIEGGCSGWEGLALTCVFGALWLWFSRSRYRFPRAFLLIPAAMVVMFCMNSLRIAALVLIGHFGSPAVAITGFHSQSGWIAFNIVAFGMAIISSRIPWFTTGTAESTAPSSVNPTVPYLLPLFAITAAGMIARASSANFDWLYSLKVVAGAAALWFCRKQYRSLQWRCGWAAPAAGALVFVLWIAMEPPTQAPSTLPGALAALSPAMRYAWIVCRIIGAVVTVPIAEELAFRGFLMRRLMSSDFESVVRPRHAWVAVLLSSLMFGVLHGDRWLAGSIAGAVYAVLMLRRGRIGDAVVAHATSNALLAWAVLGGEDWFYW
jgi:exosortase E/protease (VPEID-CTERM system)